MIVSHFMFHTSLLGPLALALWLSAWPGPGLAGPGLSLLPGFNVDCACVGGLWDGGGPEWGGLQTTILSCLRLTFPIGSRIWRGALAFVKVGFQTVYQQ